MNLYPSLPPVIKKKSLLPGIFYTLSILFICGTGLFIIYTRYYAQKPQNTIEYTDIPGKIISKFTLNNGGTITDPETLHYLAIKQQDNVITMFTVETAIYEMSTLDMSVIYSYSVTNNTISLKSISHDPE
ncbi:MAG: hypothetical protein PF637_10795 [Spirochaetes bacterium]|jgi:hypothetical protein|nr:hypothetical protein [Spirochaetota bacterium]